MSRRAGRQGDQFISPADQARRISDACKRGSLKLVDTIEEIDISGGTAIESRPGLQAAIAAIERGEISVIVVAYFDRLVRSLRVQGEILEKIEGAGGQVLAVDVGAVSQATASKWLSGSMLGLVAEYHRRSSAERSAEAQASAVARGAAPFPYVPPGYMRGADGILAPDGSAPIVAQAFTMRAEGATVNEVRDYLGQHGIKRSFHAVCKYLNSRVVLGEIHFGGLTNLNAHPPIVDKEVWDRVQVARSPRGRQPKSRLLLARLGILRCASCNARMVAGKSGSGAATYRCPATGDCKRRAHILAAKVDPVVVSAVKAALADVEGRASAQANTREAELELESAQQSLDQAISTFATAGVDTEVSASLRLADLREARDQAQKRVDELGGAGGSIVVGAADWSRLTLGERRDLIRAVASRVTIAPGRGGDRISIELLGE